VIRYKAGYKYQLQETYRVSTPIKPTLPIATEYISLSLAGDLVIQRGYAWDGPSGPTVDTKNFMRGSLVHDALYQLMREGHLVPELHRKPADELLRQMCREDGMCAIRAWWVYWGVRLGGGDSADGHHGKPVLTAP